MGGGARMTHDYQSHPQPPQELVDAWRAAADAVLSYVNNVTNEIRHDKQRLAELILEVDRARQACELAVPSSKPTCH